MEAHRLNQETKKDPKRVISLLVEYNYGDKNQDAQVVVDNFLKQQDTTNYAAYPEGTQYMINNPGPGIIELVRDELKAAGFDYIDYKEALLEVARSLSKNKKPISGSKSPEHTKWQ
jgi:hypothetical protein